MQTIHASGVLRLKQVLAATSLGKTTVYEMEKRGQFPQRVHMGPRTVGWLAEEVAAFIEQAAAQRTTPSALVAKTDASNKARRMAERSAAVRAAKVRPRPPDSGPRLRLRLSRKGAPHAAGMPQ